MPSRASWGHPVSIQRVPEIPFAQIANSALRDTRLSFKARGLLAMVLSHSGEWEAGRDWLERQSQRDGRSAIQGALNELTDLGYRVVSKVQVDGQIRTVVQWFQQPSDQVSRPTENLTVRDADRQERRRSLEHNPSEHNLSEHKSSEMFAEFWAAYPRKHARAAAVKAWEKAVMKTDPRRIIDAALALRNDPNRAAEYTPHASTWLNGERWEDGPLPAPQGRKSGTSVYADAFFALEEREGWHDAERGGNSLGYSRDVRPAIESSDGGGWDVPSASMGVRVG